LSSFQLTLPLAEEPARGYSITVDEVESERRIWNWSKLTTLTILLDFIREEKLGYAFEEIKWTLDRFPNPPHAFSLLEPWCSKPKRKSLPSPMMGWL
jgi:hypothetical protein